MVFRIPLFAALFLSACGAPAEEEFTAQGDQLILRTTIDADTDDELRAALASHPGVRELVLAYMPGSSDDAASLAELAPFLRQSGLSIRVPAWGMVASGGTDMVVMVPDRVIEPGACVGVHAWGAGWFLGAVSADELPRDDPEHQSYLDFFESVGVDPAFYWFTLEAAPADGMYWMSAEEINRFGLSRVPVSATEESDAARQARCDAR